MTSAISNPIDLRQLRRSNRAKRSNENEETITKKSRYSLEVVKLSPSSLLKKLDGVKAKDLVQCATALERKELKDLGTDVISTEEYEKMREDVRQKLSDPECFDIGGRTELNVAGAIVAGAKLVVDETRATRSMCKILKDECGVEEDDVLYKPLSYQGALYRSCQEVRENRQASVAETYVDFKKQLNFKTNVLEHVVGMEMKKAKTDQREIRMKNKYNLPPKTPVNRFDVNPLDGVRIIDNYALEVASNVRENRKGRRIAPIPFNIDCLNDCEDIFA